jgi:hypothetical protein
MDPTRGGRHRRIVYGDNADGTGPSQESLDDAVAVVAEEPEGLHVSGL